MIQDNLHEEIVDGHLGEAIYYRSDGYYFCEFQKQVLWSLRDIEHLKSQMNNIAAPILYDTIKEVLTNFGVTRYTDVFDSVDVTDDIKAALHKRFEEMLDNND